MLPDARKLSNTIINHFEEAENQCVWPALKPIVSLSGYNLLDERAPTRVVAEHDAPFMPSHETFATHDRHSSTCISWASSIRLDDANSVSGGLDQTRSTAGE